jgi:hypothetical protein
MPSTPAQDSPQYTIQIPRFLVDICGLGIAQFLADPLQAGAARKSLREMYGTTADEKNGK